MAVLFNITHDADNLDEYDSTVTDGGDLSTGTPGLASTTAKMEALIDDTNAIYGKVHLAAQSQIRTRVYIDPNTLEMADEDGFEFWRFGQRAGAWSDHVYVHLKYYVATGYQVIIEVVNDAEGNVVWDELNISDAQHYVEFHAVRATNDASNDGTFQWWVDKADQGSTGSIDNYNIMADEDMQVVLGSISGLDAGTSGTLYLDELKANDDGSEIGPVTPPAGQPTILRTFGIPTGAGARNRPGGWN